MENFDESKKKIALNSAENENLLCLIHSPTDKEKDEELPELRKWSLQVMVYLLICLTASSVALATILSYANIDLPITILLVCLSGFLGSSVSALLSINQRVAYGWEFDSGHRFPDPGVKKERFNSRHMRGLISRPFIGIVGALLVFTGCVSGVLWTLKLSDTFGIVFWSLLGGLFAKTLFEKLKDVFKGFIGKSS